jgi:uncharacterized protein (DUF302 family)
MKQKRYGIKTRIPLSTVEAEQRVRNALEDEGFGVLTEIDVAETLREKLGVERGPYLILGACNPELAHQALGSESDVGLLLPCNVVVYEEGAETVVVALDPSTMVDLTGNPELEPIAIEAKARLERVVGSLTEGVK